jgi:hypothetical protein
MNFPSGQVYAFNPDASVERRSFSPMFNSAPSGVKFPLTTAPETPYNARKKNLENVPKTFCVLKV